MPLWRPDQPIVLASKSLARRALLQAAGIPVEAIPADLDERAVEQQAKPAGPAATARLLAGAKAAAVSAAMPNRLVVGADQVLAFQERSFGKPADHSAARAQLVTLRGHTHTLHSAVAVARDGCIVWESAAEAHLTMRNFSDDFLTAYLQAAGDAVTTSVGAYQLEGLGVHLFETVVGDHATILGLPMLPLLAFLRREGCLAE
jgi:septum formation protein